MHRDLLIKDYEVAREERGYCIATVTTDASQAFMHFQLILDLLCSFWDHVVFIISL